MLSARWRFERLMLKLDLSQLTPETVSLAKRARNLAIKHVLRYCFKRRMNPFKVTGFYGQLLRISERAYERRSIDLAAIDGILPVDFLYKFAPLCRYVVERSARDDQKHYGFPNGIRFEEVDVGNGLPSEWATVPGASTRKAFLYVHGGGWFTGSPRASRPFSAYISASAKVRVFSPAYRLYPEHPHPAQIDDVAAAYKWLLGSGVDARDVVVAGESAGAHLVLLLLLRARLEGLPMPAAGVVMSPPTDLTLSGASVVQNMPSDPVLGTSGMGVVIQNMLWHLKTDPRDPGFSPLLADLRGLPPLLVQVSKVESLYNDATRLVEKIKEVGGEVTLQEWDGVQHAFQMAVSRRSKVAVEACNRVVDFLNLHWQ